MRDRHITILVAVLVVCLIALVSFETIRNIITTNNRDKIETKVSEYRVEKRELEQELSSLQSAHIKETVGASRLMLLFSSIDNVFVEEICPILDAKNIVALICLDKDALPEEDSVLSVEDYNGLLDKGWQTVLYFNGESDLNEWYSDNEKAFNSAGLEIPTVLLLDDDNFDDDIAKELYTFGFEDIILKSKKPDISREDIVDGPTVTDSTGWYTNVASSIIDRFSSKTGDIVFRVGGELPEEAYDQAQFSAMLNVISKSIDNERVFFTTPRGAKEHMSKLAETYTLTIDEFNKEKNRLESRIKELDILIQKEYDEYLDKK